MVKSLFYRQFNFDISKDDPFLYSTLCWSHTRFWIFSGDTARWCSDIPLGNILRWPFRTRVLKHSLVQHILNALQFFNTHIWFTQCLEYAVQQYFWRSSLTVDTSFVSKIERGFKLVKHRDHQAINLCLYGFLCNCIIQ